MKRATNKAATGGSKDLNVEVDVELLSRLGHYIADHPGATKKAVVTAALDAYLKRYEKRGA